MGGKKNFFGPQKSKLGSMGAQLARNSPIVKVNGFNSPFFSIFSVLSEAAKLFNWNYDKEIHLLTRYLCKIAMDATRSGVL